MELVQPSPTFLGAPFEAAGRQLPAGGFAFLGVPCGVPYDREARPAQPAAPHAVRAASQLYRDDLDHYDFDLGAAPFPRGAAARLADCGDVPGDPHDPAATMAAVTGAVTAIAAAGCAPLVIGVDHSIPPLVVRGLPGDEPLDVLHIDAHLDFRDELGGVRDGYSSPLRRLRELPWVRRIVQVGLRDIGSARPQEVAAARAAGNVLIGAAQVHESGVDPLGELFAPGARLYVTIDVDGLDPSCAPGVIWPAPGGLHFWQAAKLLRDLTARCRLVGMDVCEFAPAYDVNGQTGLVVTRLLMLAMGADPAASA
jgi:agmatinase